MRYFRTALGPGEKDSFLFPSLRIARLFSGHCLWQIGPSTVELSRGELVFLNNLTPRRILKSENLVLDIFEFSPAALQGYPALLGAFYKQCTTVLPPKSEGMIAPTLDLLAAAGATQPESAYTAHLTDAAFSLLDCLFASLGFSQPSGIAFDAAAYIWQHFSESLSVPELAKHLHVSKNHLGAQFRQVHGIGVAAYIRLIRLHHAQQLLLRDPERCVLDIAFSCGFQSSAGFYKAYRAVYATPPRLPTK